MTSINPGLEGLIVQINISTGGVPKKPVLSARVERLGITGDVQRNKKYHGGPKQALLLIASEVIDTLREEGWPLFYGALGENFTTRGLNHRLWRAGQRYRVGSVVLEFTKPRAPCSQLDPYGIGIQKRIYDDYVKALNPASDHWGESGFYAAILQPGELSVNDIIKSAD